MLCGFTITVIDSIMRKAFQGRTGVQFGDVDVITNLMFADDSAVFANVDEDATDILTISPVQPNRMDQPSILTKLKS